MIKFSHTLFALPFALVASADVYKHYGHQIRIGWRTLIAIIVAFTALRSFAMAANRVADYEIDRLNPRTVKREIPAGRLSMTQVKIFAVISFVIFCAAAFELSNLAGWLSPILAILVAFYSYTKRFTLLCHFWLGAVIGLAPIAVYVALLSQIPLQAVLMALVLMTYIAGFDILYALQDRHFDRDHNLHSIPSRLGAKSALYIAFFTHTASLVILAFLIVQLRLPFVSWVGWIFCAGALFLEHKIARKQQDTISFGANFYRANIFFSLSYGFFLILGLIF